RMLEMKKSKLLSILLGLDFFCISDGAGLLPVRLQDAISRFIIPSFVILLFFLGILFLIFLLYKVYNLRDCPQAQIELTQQIDKIRMDSRYKSLFRKSSTM
ncbi:unnamed protein product, partial [Didymodactylos carnosus]